MISTKNFNRFVKEIEIRDEAYMRASNLYVCIDVIKYSDVSNNELKDAYMLKCFFRYEIPAISVDLIDNIQLTSVNFRCKA